MPDLNFILKATNEASGVLSAVQRDIDALAHSADRGSGVLGKMGNILATGVKAGALAAVGAVTALTGAMVATAVSGTNMAMALEAEISGIAAVLGESKDAIAPLKDLILDLGMDPNLKVDAEQAAQAIAMLARNGLDMAQIMDGAAHSTVLLANATRADFGTAADIATDAMALFSIEASNMKVAVDGIVGVTNSSKFSINDYRLALAQAGGVASSVGVEFDDFNTTIAAMAPLFASGSDAGTSFKTFLLRLAPDTDKAKQAMADLGLMTERGSSAFFDASGNLKSMAEISSLLHEATKGLSEEQKNLAFNTIFGTDAMRAAFGVASAGEVVYTDAAEAAKALGVSHADLAGYIEGGITAYEALQIQMSKTDALESAKMRMDNLAGALEILQGVIDTIKIRIGDAFIPSIRSMAEATTNFLDNNADQIVAFFETFAEWLGPRLQAAVAIGMGSILALGGVMEQATAIFETARESIGAAIVFVQDHIEGFKGAILALGAVFAALALAATITGVGAAILSLLNPITLAIAAVAALGFAWGENWGGIRDKTEEAWNAIQPPLQTLIEWLETNIPTALTALQGAWNQAWPALKDAFHTAWTYIEDGLEAGSLWLRDTLPGALSTLQSAWDTGWGALAGGFAEMEGWLSDLLPAAAALFVPHIEGIGTALAEAAEDVGPLQEALQRLVDAALPALEALATFIVGTLVVAIKAILIAVEAVLPVALEIVTAAVDGMTAALTLITTVLTAVVAGVTAIMAGDWAGAWAAGQNIVSAFSTYIQETLSSLWIAAVAIVQALGAAVVLALDEMGMEGQEIVGSLVQGVVNDFNRLKTFLAIVVEGIRMGIAIDFQRIKNAVVTATNEAKDLVVNAWNTARTTLESIWTGIRSAAESAFGAIRTTMTALVSAKDAVVNAFASLKDFLSGLTIPNPFAGLLGTLDGLISKAGNAASALAGIGGGGGGQNNAAGTAFYPGGRSTINERGGEMVIFPGGRQDVWLPRGTQIVSAEQTAGMLGGGGVVMHNTFVVNNDLDMEAAAWRLAQILERRQPRR